MDGCSRQNPAYRSAKGKAPASGPFLVEGRDGDSRPLLAAGDGPLASVLRLCERMFVVVCVLIPRFELSVAAGGREALAAGPLALAPELGRESLVGETSAAAEAYGVHAGLRLGEALARCPTLRLVAPDPAGVADAWEKIVGALGGIGASGESGRPGTAWVAARGLRRLP